MTDQPSCPPAPEGQTEEFTVAADPKLEAEGWVRRNLSDPSRVDEVADLYRATGYEVHIQKLKAEDFDARCVACALSICSTYVLIYTRKKSPA
jgi:hypothetical protein